MEGRTQCSRCRLPAVLYSNFKSLQQAQVCFTDGWVQDLEIVKVGQKTVVRSKWTKFGGDCVRKAEFCAHALIPSVIIEERVTQ
ncbi:hypothetical protein DPX16_0044 [Anabarilius grahami]|uniref:Uncharacterized protein n=1 Tax=Anabarilius grahami TaxID=495550 RepID=A0A3N0Y1F6_ANAGA|nr:hypothetical protein DPX16_0044 [Anabarilius grahami]